MLLLLLLLRLLAVDEADGFLEDWDWGSDENYG